MTYYTLVVRNVKTMTDFQDIGRYLEELDLIKYVFDRGEYFDNRKEALFSSWEDQKWRSYNGTMIIMSERFPKMTFELTMQTGDNFYRTYYKDGETENCQGEIVYEAPQKIKWDTLVSF